MYLAERADVVDERTVLCVLTHDPKFDVPLLEAALRTRAGYIGAMGSRRTHEDRLAGLLAAGVLEPALTRLRRSGDHRPVLGRHGAALERAAVRPGSRPAPAGAGRRCSNGPLISRMIRPEGLSAY